jgi:hypothetical protein
MLSLPIKYETQTKPTSTHTHTQMIEQNFWLLENEKSTSKSIFFKILSIVCQLNKRNIKKSEIFFKLDMLMNEKTFILLIEMWF